MYAQIFGSNLQMAVWVSTLSLAGFTAYKEFQAGNSEAVGKFRITDWSALTTTAQLHNSTTPQLHNCTNP